MSQTIKGLIRVILATTGLIPMVRNEKMSKPKMLVTCMGYFMGIQVIIVNRKFECHASKFGDYDSYNPYNSAFVQIKKYVTCCSRKSSIRQNC